jgi:carbon-monoxide dehydrogenase large subunit
MNERNAYFGSPVRRLEDLRLLRGRGRYIDDVSESGELHAAILRSSVAHGKLSGIDTSPALRLPGVWAVLTAADLGPQVPTIPLRLIPLPELEPFAQPVLATGKVRYVGEPLAMVLAESAAIAEDALNLIAVSIDPLPAAPAGAADAVLFEHQPTNTATTYRAERGDAASFFANAPYRRTERFVVQRHAAMPMEPRGLLAVWDGASGRLTLTGAAKVPGPNRKVLAAMMGLDLQAVDLIETDVGGGFGSRGEFYPEDFLVPFAARYCGRPVKWTQDRREHLLADNHAREMEFTVEIACGRDGTILGLRGHASCDIGAYVRTNASIAPRNLVQYLAGPYRVPHVDLSATMVLSNKTPCGTYRGPGRFEADFVRERLFDIVAKDLQLDRIAFRRQNLITSAEMPYQVARLTPYLSETEYDSGDYLETFDRCIEAIGWNENRPLGGRLVDGRYHGFGIGCFIEGGAAGPKEDARVVVEPDNTITVYVGSAALGQGLQTILTQIAADAFELPMERITVRHGSTTYIEDGQGSFHSRSTVMGGSAVVVASNNLKREIRAAAAKRFGCAPTGIDLIDGHAVGPNGVSAAWAELAGGDGLSADGTFFNSKHTTAYGTAAAHVAVDAKTGDVEVLDYVCTEDVGRIANPDTLHGQVIGSIVQGLGGVFLEHLIYDDDGQLLVGSFADYLLPCASDFPNIRAISTGHYPAPNNPLGAKGGGEGGVVAVGGVIANAVADALQILGVEPRDLPLSPARVWQMIEDARMGEALMTRDLGRPSAAARRDP